MYNGTIKTGLAMLLTLPAPSTPNLLQRPDVMSENIQQLSLLTLAEGKTCKQCGEWKPRVKFFKNTSKDGRSPRCRNCSDPPEKQRERDRARYQKPARNKQVRDRVRQWSVDNAEHVRRQNHLRYEANKEIHQAWGRQYYIKNKARINVRSREYRKLHPRPRVARRKRLERTREEIREMKRVHRLANPERYREIDRRRYIRDKPKRLAAVKAYHKAHPEVKQLIEARRRARVKGSEGKLTKTEWDELCSKYDYRCLCCKQLKKLTVDHVIPLSKGGTHTLENVQPLCVDCNRSKNTRSTDYRT